MEMYINRYLNDLTNDMIRWTLDQPRSYRGINSQIPPSWLTSGYIHSDVEIWY